MGRIEKKKNFGVSCTIKMPDKEEIRQIQKLGLARKRGLWYNT